MSDRIPRRLIDELITGWQLTGERIVLVEGADDQRFLRLIQAEEHCDEAIAVLHALSADAVDVPSDVVARHGITGTGAKQRVIAFAREIENAGASDGFRGVVDRDQDQLLSLDFRSHVLKYTDHGCMEIYGWSPKSLRRLLVQYRCEAKVPTAAAVRALFQSINGVCAALAAVRAAALRVRTWELRIHQTDSTIMVHNGKADLNLRSYILLARPPKGEQSAVEAEVARFLAEIEAADPLDVINGHDLTWVLLVVLRELTALPRRVIDEATVSGGILSQGVSDPALIQRPLFQDLASWAAA
jgi:hypothetical protein